MADKAKIGIIGVGQIGDMHLQTYQKLPVEIVAVADVDEEAANRAAQEYGVEKTFTDFRELLKIEEIQAVDVCLHNNLHAPVTIAALEAGKHVYCEKPIAGSYVDGQAMVNAAEKTGQMLAMQLFTLFSLDTKAAQRLIQEGYLGDIYYAKSMGYRRR
ncbi:MAG: Gfo/Idh/MocA family oxidoreductase, partial [Armatimonadetes bacterium]|nr:Gfo/Idh/MocA family oxidoreductase [Armatimonadota bacterium]